MLKCLIVKLLKNVIDNLWVISCGDLMVIIGEEIIFEFLVLFDVLIVMQLLIKDIVFEIQRMINQVNYIFGEIVDGNVNFFSWMEKQVILIEEIVLMMVYLIEMVKRNVDSV